MRIVASVMFAVIDLVVITPDDIYVSPSQIRRFGLRTGDTIEGHIRSRISAGARVSDDLLYGSLSAGRYP
jgi:hypothetical protein